MSESTFDDGLLRLEQAPPLREQVHEKLEGLIVSGALRPGTRLVEGELAQRLGVSRGPVRETLQLLSNDGFVDLRPRQGAFVHVPTQKEVDDFFEIRRVLECESARLAALRITPEGAERLQEVLRTAKAILEEGHDPSAFHDRVHIHEEITIIAGNPLLAQMLKALTKRWRWYLSPFDPQRRRQAWTEHRTLIGAIRRGEAEEAVKAMDIHNARARENYLAMIEGGSSDS